MYRNGDVFQGSYKGGIRCGKGKYKFANGQIIEGQWFGEDNINGVIYYNNGDMY